MVGVAESSRGQNRCSSLRKRETMLPGNRNGPSFPVSRERPEEREHGLISTNIS